MTPTLFGLKTKTGRNIRGFCRFQRRFGWLFKIQKQRTVLQKPKTIAYVYIKTGPPFYFLSNLQDSTPCKWDSPLTTSNIGSNLQHIFNSHHSSCFSRCWYLLKNGSFLLLFSSSCHWLMMIIWLMWCFLDLTAATLIEHHALLVGMLLGQTPMWTDEHAASTITQEPELMTWILDSYVIVFTNAIMQLVSTFVLGLILILHLTTCWQLFAKLSVKTDFSHTIYTKG